MVVGDYQGELKEQINIGTDFNLKTNYDIMQGKWCAVIHCAY